MRRYERHELIRFLKRLDEKLEERAVILVIGGAAALLHYGATRATRDIDLFQGLNARVRQAATWAAEATGLAIPIDRAAVADPPFNYEDRLKRLRFKFEKLVVLVPERHDLVLMKTLRAERHDLDVIEEIHRHRALDFDTLARRFDEEMGQAIGDPTIFRIQFQNVIARLFGKEAAESVAKPRPRRPGARMNV